MGINKTNKNTKIMEWMATKLRNKKQAVTNATARFLMAENKEFSIWFDRVNKCIVKEVHETGIRIPIDTYHTVTYDDLEQDYNENGWNTEAQ